MFASDVPEEEQVQLCRDRKSGKCLCYEEVEEIRDAHKRTETSNRITCLGFVKLFDCRTISTLDENQPMDDDNVRESMDVDGCFPEASKVSNSRSSHEQIQHWLMNRRKFVCPCLIYMLVTYFSAGLKNTEQFTNLYMVATLPTKEHNDSFGCCYFKNGSKLGRPAFKIPRRCGP